MLPQNLRFLRKKQRVSQQELADVMGIARTTLGDYERGKTEPNIDTLIRLASFFDINVDQLINSKLSLDDLEIARTPEMRVLAISMDQEQNQNIELIDRKAEAGYLEGFQDPEFIGELPKLYFPQMPEGTYRAFEIQGESMLPVMPGSVVICNYVDDIKNLKNDKTYVIATVEGIVYKRIQNHPKESKLTAVSDNPEFPPYTIAWKDILEIWEYYAHVSFSDQKLGMDQWLHGSISEIQRKLDHILKQ